MAISFGAAVAAANAAAIVYDADGGGDAASMGSPLVPLCGALSSRSVSLQRAYIRRKFK
jgi:hypothetical protein